MTAQPSEATTTRTFWDVPDAPTDGAWREKRRLAAALRELAALCVTSDAPETTLGYAADSVERIVERLASHPHRTFKQGLASCKTPEDLARFADRNTMTGLSNPYSPPMELSMEGDRAIARVTFGPVFEGIPGHVHGGIMAAAFDQIFGYLQSKRGVGSLTGELTIRYRKPTPLQTPLVLEARVLDVEGRRTIVAARMSAGDVVTAEADGIFIAVDARQLRTVIARGIEG